MVLIGFLARKRAGKDTCGDYLVQQYGFQKVSFAEPLKEGCRVMFNLNDQQLNGELKESVDPNWGVSPRSILQFVGTDLFRTHMDRLIPGIGNNFWTTSLKVKYMKAMAEDPEARFVVTDVRFQNEVDLINSLGGTVVKLVRPGLSWGDTHPSEDIDSVNGYYYTVYNNGTVAELYSRVDSLIKIEHLFDQSPPS